MRTILITGASGGLAQSLVKLLPKDQLILLGRDKAKLEKRYAHHQMAHCYQVDMADDAAISALMTEIYEHFGQIDILINNAGYGFFKPFEEVEMAEIRAMFEVNSFALMTFSRLVGIKMKAAGHGQIINIVSMAGLVATAKSSAYAASKFAALGFSNSLRLELAEFGVQVLTVNPGPIATPFFETADPNGAYVKSLGKMILSPDLVAKKVVAAMGTKKREINLPWFMAIGHKLYVLFPRMADILSRKLFNYK